MNTVDKEITGTIKPRGKINTDNFTDPKTTEAINRSIETANKRIEEEMRKGHNRLPNFGRIGKSTGDEGKSSRDEER